MWPYYTLLLQMVICPFMGSNFSSVNVSGFETRPVWSCRLKTTVARDHIAEDFSDWYHLTAEENNEHNVGVKCSV